MARSIDSLAMRSQEFIRQCLPDSLSVASCFCLATGNTGGATNVACSLYSGWCYHITVPFPASSRGGDSGLGHHA